MVLKNARGINLLGRIGAFFSSSDWALAYRGRMAHDNRPVLGKFRSEHKTVARPSFVRPLIGSMWRQAVNLTMLGRRLPSLTSRKSLRSTRMCVLLVEKMLFRRKTR